MRIFVTGASGWIGSAVVPELLAAGHHVVGLARSSAAADKLEAAGASVERGTLDDLDVLRRAAGASDGVIHLAFKHDLAFSGDYESAADADRKAVETFGETLAGSDRPLVIASGILGLAAGRVATERDMPPPLDGGFGTRLGTAQVTLDLATRGVRSSVMRLSPTVHGTGDQGFLAILIAVARAQGVSGYIDAGANRWTGVHRFDAARLFRLAVEKAPAGSVLHATVEEGVPLHAIAEIIGRHLSVPLKSIAAADAVAHFGAFGPFIGVDGPASSAITRELLDWQPTHPGMIDDLEAGHYFGVIAAGNP